MIFPFSLFFNSKPAATPAPEKWRIDWRRDELQRNWTAAMWQKTIVTVAAMRLGHNLNAQGKAELASMINEYSAKEAEATRLYEEFKNLHG